MTVNRIHNLDHQTRYELRADTGLACALIYSAEPGEPASWKILLPGPDGTEDLYGTRQTPDPDADWLRFWLAPIIGADQAAELAAAAVDAAPTDAGGPDPDDADANRVSAGSYPAESGMTPSTNRSNEITARCSWLASENNAHSHDRVPFGSRGALAAHDHGLGHERDAERQRVTTERPLTAGRHDRTIA